MIIPNLKQKPNIQVDIKLRPVPWYGRWWGELLIAGLITLVFGRSFVAGIFDKLPTDGSDIYENAWVYWHWKHSLFESFSNPYFTNYIYYPAGIPLYLHANQPLVALQAIIFQVIFGQILGINLVILLALTLATWWSARLFFYISQHRAGAWLGAIIFVWCNSWLWDFFKSGQVNLISLQWIPLYVLWLLKAFDTTQGRRQWLYTGGAGFALLASSLTDFYYTLHLIILTGLATLFYLVFRAKSWEARFRIGLKATAIGGLWLAAISPLLLNMLAQSSNRLWYVPSQSQTVLRSVDLLSFFFPNGHNPLFGSLAGGNLPTDLYRNYNPSGVDGSFNPGYIPLLLALLAVIFGLRRKGVAFGLWSFLGVTFAGLALGPQLHLNGATFEQPKLPYWYLYQLPGLNVSRDPSNFSVPYLLAIAALASLGLRELAGWAENRWPRPLAFGLKPGVLLSVALIGACSLEFLPLQIEMGLDPVPAFYRETLAADKADYAILEVPSYAQDGGLEHLRMYYQTFHQKKLLGGQLARDHKRLNPTDFLSHSTFFPEALVNDTAIPYAEADMLSRPKFPELSSALLDYFKVRYIVVYPGAIKPEQQDNTNRFLTRALGPNPQPVYQDNMITAYRVPSVGAAKPNSPKVVVDVGQGWFKPDVKNGVSWRWGQFGYSAEIYLTNLTDQPRKIRLDFKAFSYAVPRSVRLTLNYERDVATYQLPASPPGQPRNEQPFSLELELKPGSNILTFFTFEQPVIPASRGDGPDGRKLTYGVREVTVRE